MLKTDSGSQQGQFIHKPLHEFPLEEVYVEGKRHYKVDELLLPSVTTVLSSLSKEGLEAWIKKVGEEEANRIKRIAAARGTKVHEIFENYLKNDPMYLKGHMPANVASFKQLKPWLDDNVTSILGNEIALHSKKLKSAGRCDLIAEVNGEPAILDFKTSQKEKRLEWIKSYCLQVTTYAIMVYELYGIYCKKAYILITVDDGPPQIFEILTKDYFEEVRQVFKDYHREKYIKIVNETFS